MVQLRCLVLMLLSMGLLCQSTNAVFMDKLAHRKLCADNDCSYAISMARALDDYTAPDCRFINLKRGQMIYIYSKLKPAEGNGVFWSGSVYSDRYVDQMGIIGYFPSNHVNETRTFKKHTVLIPTTDMDFYCA